MKKIREQNVFADNKSIDLFFLFRRFFLSERTVKIHVSSYFFIHCDMKNEGGDKDERGGA